MIRVEGREQTSIYERGPSRPLTKFFFASTCTFLFGLALSYEADRPVEPVTSDLARYGARAKLPILFSFLARP